MNTLRLTHEDSQRSRRNNSHRVWCRFVGPSLEPKPAPEDAAVRIHGGFASISPEALRPISERCFFTIGSCFARVIEMSLRKHGVRVPSADEKPFSDALYLFKKANNDTRFTSFLNRYNLPSMLQELRILVEGFPPSDANWLLYRNGEKWCDLHYADNFVDVSLEECHQRRTIVSRFLSHALRAANTYVLTLGLCEAWFDRNEQAYLNQTPPPRVASANPGRFEWHFLDFQDNLRTLSSIYELLCNLKGSDEFELILTVSPVPLNYTFTSRDVVVANTEAKAILRAAAGEAVRRFARATYFPAYEIVMYSNPAVAWEPDKIHVQMPMSEHVVSTFMELLGADRGT
jgi:hypothetical protein